ncbi:MAG: 4-hydroxyphenylacetate 3-hydroxylase C-terminal domain-containing protein [Deinococcales bacterium]
MNNVRLANRAYGETGAVYHMAHQVINIKIAKTEAFLGVAEAMVEMIGSRQFQHVQQKVSEIIINLEVMKALKLASEEQAEVDKYGTMTPARGPLNAARNLYPQLYPRMVEILQLLGASGIIMIPTEKDRKGPMGDHLKKYLQASNANSDERIKLFRLAWDMTLSSFGARQNLYEKFFFGDPVRTQCALYEGYDKAPYVEKIKSFLALGNRELGVNWELGS